MFMKKLLLTVISCVLALCANAADEVTAKISSSDIVAGKTTKSAALGTNSYGKQAVADTTTWYNFNFTKYSFTGCRICVAQDSNGGGIQIQGNDKDKAKQGFIGNLTAFNKISKIEVVARVGVGSSYDPSFNVYVGTESLPNTDMITADTVKTVGEKFRTYNLTYNVTGEIGYFAIRNNINGALYLDSIYVTYEGDGTIAVVAPKFETKAGNYIGAQYVKISAEEGAKIYYTTDESDPTTSDTKIEYTDSIKVEATTTIKAAAMVDNNWSDFVTATYTILTPIAKMSDVQKAAKEADSQIAINFDGWVCTGIKSSNAYFTDNNGLGIILYQSSHGFKAGDKLSGNAIATIVLYNGFAELKNLTATTEGLKVTTGGEAKVTESTIDDLSFANQGAVVTLKNLKYNKENNVFTDGMADITPYNTFMKLPDFVESDKVTYDITGVVIYFKNGDKMVTEIAPRSEDDIVKHTQLEDPESAWSASAETIFEGKTATVTFSTKASNVTYESNDTTVATVSADGVITAVAKGTATISATTAEDDTYTSSYKEIIINVIKEGEILFPVDDFLGQGTSGSGSEVKTEKEGVTVTMNKAYAAATANHIKIYGSTMDEDGNITKASTVTVSAPEGKHVAMVVLTATSANYIMGWKVDADTLVIKDKEATWVGKKNTVVINLNASKQARIVSIDVILGNGAVEEPADAIETVVAEEAKNGMYNISGQKVNANYKGIVIINGKKMYRK